MIVLASLAVGVLLSFSSSIVLEISKYYISEILNSQKNFADLRKTLDKELQELSKTLENFDASVSYLDLPPEWLDDLQQCWYEMEDIEESMDSAKKMKIVTKFMLTHIIHVQEMHSKLKRKEVLMVPRRRESLEDAFPADEFIWVEIKRKIIEDLTAESDTYGGVSIIGIGGLGKTVLAKSIAAEKSIETHFPCILSPPSSPDFDSKSLLDYIKDKLPTKGQKVLILMDGLDSVSSHQWRQFQLQYLQIHSPKAKLLITTQNPRIADATNTSKQYMRPLSDKECFSLIQNFARTNGKLISVDANAINHNKKELIEACKGSPLLATHIGLLLSRAEEGCRLDTIKDITTTTSPWKKSGSEWISQNLKLVNLLNGKPHLKRCLAYLSLFPQGHEFEENDLVQFWMAEGFTQFSGTRDASYLSKATRRNLEDLRSCSLFQISKSPPGKEPTYKMDKLAYELAQNVASSSFCQNHIGKSINKITQTTRHFSLLCKDNGNDVIKSVAGMLDDIESNCHNLRSFLLLFKAGEKIKNPIFFQKLTHLRVLDLRYTNLEELESKHLSQLINLRYLDLSHTPVRKLSKLSENPALQVLKLIRCEKLRKLPIDVTKLANLISIQVNLSYLGRMIPSIGELRNLQRLDVFIVGTERGLMIEELKNLNYLRKSLCITRLENVNTKLKAENAELNRKGMLESLELQWTSPSQVKPKKGVLYDPNLVLEGLEPPKNLEELIITNYCGSEFPDWLGKSQVCGVLKSIHLDHCEALLSLPALDQLNSLERLQLDGCKVLEKLPTLPTSLKSLVIKDSHILKQRCQTGEADWNTIRDINHVEIDSNRIDTSKRHQAEAVGHQQQDQGR